MIESIDIRLNKIPRIVVRETDKPEREISQRGMIEAAMPEAAEYVDKSIDCKKITKGKIDKEMKDIRRSLRFLDKQDPRCLPLGIQLKELESIDDKTMQRMIGAERNRQIADRAAKLGKDRFDSVILAVMKSGVDKALKGL
jgi:hypothetical protein